MKSKIKTARIAGLFYLLVVVFSFFYMEYVPSEIMVSKDPETTLENLLSFESLFRVGVFVGVLVHISFILLPLKLYQLLHPVNKNYALLMVVFALISIPISYTILIDQVTVLDLIKNHDPADIPETKAMGLKVTAMFTKLYNVFFMSQTFWGLWLLPFGYLVYKSGFLPKVLGIFLMLGCVAYLIDVFGAILFPNYYDYVNTRLLILPAAIGEIGICLWLLTVGVKENIRY